MEGGRRFGKIRKRGLILNTKFHWLNILLDTVALIIALIVDLILNIICMLILAPGPLEAVGFVAISFVVVLFSIRSWLKGNKLLWAMFALVCFFFDLSFTLIATDVQSKSATVVTVDSDQEFSYLTKRAAASAAALADLRAQYSAAVRRETMDELDAQIKQAQRVADDADAARTARRAQIESGALNAAATRQRATITATMIFEAIPVACAAGRFVPLAVFALIFAGLQVVMVTAASSGIKKKGRKPYVYRARDPKRIPLSPEEQATWRPWVESWVSVSWIDKRSGWSSKILDREAFRQYIEKKGAPFSDHRYAIIRSAAQLGEVVAPNGEIIEPDETKAIEKILGNLLTKIVRKPLKVETMKQPELF